MRKSNLLSTANVADYALSSNINNVVRFTRFFTASRLKTRTTLDLVWSIGKKIANAQRDRKNKDRLFSPGLKILFSLAALFLPLMAQAEVPKWKILPEKSSISFTATQNNAPVTGEFKTFTGEINFDPLQLSVSNVMLSIDIGSVTTSYPEIAKTLKTPEWFNVAQFPQATFKATSFTKTGDTTYEAKGTLTLRDKTAPLNVTFDLQPVTKTTTIAKGEATLERSTFGVGRGEWASTDEVKDDVKINFTLAVTKQ